MLIQDFLEETAARLPQKVALVCDDRSFTYADLDAAANRLANALRHAGVQRGDRVGVFLENGPEAVISVFGILKADAAFIVVNPGTRIEKLTYILANAEASALIADGHKRSTVDAVVPRVPSLKALVVTGSQTERAHDGRVTYQGFDAIQRGFAADRPSRANIDLDLACLIYTSGSTGEPKGVMTDHSNAVFVSTSIITYLGNVQDDVILNVLPLSFGYGLYQVFMAFRVGARLVLERSFTFPATVLERMQRERVTGFPGVPTMFSLVLQMDLSSYDLSSLRYVTNAAAALPPNHVLELRRRLPRTDLYCMYGLTETARALYLPPQLIESKPASVGIAIPGTEVWLEDEEGNRLGSGRTGELVVRGRHVMRGYWNAPEATAARFRPGTSAGERVCYTGDLFSMDDEGHLYFVGRKDEMIKSRGEKIAPVEVEKILYTLPGVIEVAVIGVPDPILGQAVKAFIVPNGIPLTREIVLAHCKQRMEDHMVPKHIEFRAALPRTGSGKIMKTGLV